MAKVTQVEGKPGITIIGVGRLGGALALALAEKGFLIEALVARNTQTARRVRKLISPPPPILAPDQLERISADIILIATQDPEIEAVANGLLAAAALTYRPFVLHTSGSLSSGVLQKLKNTGWRTGSLHPLVSISDAFSGAQSFADVFFCIEGEPLARRMAEQIAADLGGRSFSVETEMKALYHASAVTACGHLVALVDVAVEMLSKCGLDEEKARKILLPLIKSTVENLEKQTPAEALTGTFARGDAETLERHLAAIAKNVSPEIGEVYRQLGERSLHLAERRNLSGEKLNKMREKLSLAKKNRRC